MTEEIKNEALEQLDLDIKFGFEKEIQLFDRIRDMFYDEDDFDEAWLTQTISDKYSQHQSNSLSWTYPTDFDKLAKTFDELIKDKIVCLHNAGYTRQDGEGDCMETIKQLDKLGIKTIGFCYYHAQDLERAVNPEERSLYLGFHSATRNNSQAFLVATKIIDQLKQNGFEVDWPQDIDKRIEIKNIDWKKVPDNQEWGEKRVIDIMKDLPNELKNLPSDKRPFWKFW